MNQSVATPNLSVVLLKKREGPRMLPVAIGQSEAEAIAL